MGYTEKGKHYFPETLGEAAAAAMAMQRWNEEQAANKREQSIGNRARRLVEKVKKELL